MELSFQYNPNLLFDYIFYLTKRLYQEMDSFKTFKILVDNDKILILLQRGSSLSKITLKNKYSC